MENVCIISHFIDILTVFTDVKICIWIWISQIFFFSQDRIRCGCVLFSHNLHNLLIDLAIFILLLWFDRNRTNCFDCRYRLCRQLVWLSARASETYHFNRCTLSRTGLLHGTRFDSLYCGNFWQGKRIIWVGSKYWLFLKRLHFFQLFKSSCSYYLVFRSVSQF